MNKKNLDTNEILDAIKNMMSENSISNHQDLPKDVIDLTNPLNRDKLDENEEVLELTELVSEDTPEKIAEKKYKENILDTSIKNKNLINEDQIRSAIQNSLKSISSERLDEIIDEEITKIILEKLSNTKVILSSKDD